VGGHLAEAAGDVGTAPGIGADALPAVVLVHALLFGLVGLFLAGLLLAPVLLLLLQAALPLQTGLLLALLLLFLLPALPLLGGRTGGFIVLLEQLGADGL